MATKTYINNNYETLAAAMQALVTMGYFASVVYTSNTVTCYDEEENAVLTLTKNTATFDRLNVTFRLADGTTKTSSMGSSNQSTYPTYFYVCSKGAYIDLAGTLGMYLGVIISKTNNDKVGICIIGGNGIVVSNVYRAGCSAFAVDDAADQTNSVFTFGVPTARNQTTLIDIPTCSAANNVSYFPDVKYTLTSQINYVDNATTPPVSFTQDGKRYLWVGYFAIRDEN